MISIIIPAYNPNEILIKSIEALISQDPENINYEIIIIDDNSNESLKYIEKDYSKTKVIRNTENLGPAASRNIGIKNSNGEILLFIDADVIITYEILVKVNQFFKNPDNDALVGNVSISKKNVKFIIDFLRLQVHYNFNSCENQYFSTLNTEFGAIRREIIDEIGYFDDSYKQADVEDFEYGTRIRKNHKIFLDNSIEIEHNFNTSVCISLKKCVRRSFLWMKILLREKQFENAQATKSRAISSLSAFILINSLIFGLIFNAIYVGNKSIFNWIFSLTILIFLLIFLKNEIPFLKFVYKKRGVVFVTKSFFYNLLSLYSIGFGSFFGIIYFFFIKKK